VPRSLGQFFFFFSHSAFCSFGRFLFVALAAFFVTFFISNEIFELRQLSYFVIVVLLWLFSTLCTLAFGILHSSEYSPSF
jgi:hypothetical protein